MSWSRPIGVPWSRFSIWAAVWTPLFSTARLPAVIAATDANKAMHVRCRKFLSAAASLIGDSARIAAECTDDAKAVRCATPHRHP